MATLTIGYLKLSLLLIAFTAGISCFGQPPAPAYSLEKIFDQQVYDFDIDNLGQIYLLLPNQRLKKLNADFDSVAVFNDVRKYGSLHSFDVSNPLRVLLYYKEFVTAVLLDRFLNIRTALDLRQAGILQCNTIAQSFDNNIWLFDELDNQLKKVDENGKLLISSPDFRMLFEVPPHPTELEDYNRNLYAYDSATGLIVMDYYGASKALLPYKGWRHLQGIGKGMAAINHEGLVYYEPGKPGYQTQPLAPEILSAQKIRLHGQRLYALYNNHVLKVYVANQPSDR